jgi:hypothetical protein
MKKFLTLVLALVLALGLTVPALAFTSDDAADADVPYDLSIYLVEYEDNDLFGMVSLPASDRGYAKNEIVAAVIELYVPTDEDPYADGYRSLDIGGDNVSFNVTDVPQKTSNAPALTEKATKADGGNTTSPLWIQLDGKNTFKWLVFAKVTDDDASITAKLVDGTAGDEFTNDTDSITVTLDGDTYTIAKSFVTGTGGTYTITGGGDTIVIDVDKNYKSTGMSINGSALGVNTKGELGIVSGAQILTDGTTYENVMDVYDDVVVDVFGMDYFLIGNYVRDSFFTDLVSADTVIATVDIEPWTAYVSVPDNVVVDPPKTGDAASIMGFVMVALSGAGAVALKKRG